MSKKKLTHKKRKNVLGKESYAYVQKRIQTHIDFIDY